MERLLFIFLSQLLWLNCLAQKPPLDLAALRNWPDIFRLAISNDGHYIAYELRSGSQESLFIQSTDHQFKKEYHGVSDPGRFTEDSRRIIFQRPGNILSILELKTGKEFNIPRVISFQMPKAGSGQWLAYTLEDHGLTLVDFHTGQQSSYAGVVNFLFSDRGNLLLLETSMKDSPGHELRWVDLEHHTEKKIWSGHEGSNYCFDSQEKQLAFIAREGSPNKSFYTVYYYHAGSDTAQKWIDNRTAGITAEFVLANSALTFSPNGQRLILGLNHVVMPPDQTLVAVDVWNYKDDYLQYSQLENWSTEKYRVYQAAITVGANQVIPLQSFSMPFLTLSPDTGTAHALLYTDVNINAGYRNKKDRPDIYMEDTGNGGLTCIAKQVPNANPAFSPGGQYVYWYNELTRAYFTYNIKTGLTVNISKHVKCPLFDEHWEAPSFPPCYGVGEWLADDAGILIYDAYDIWLLDPASLAPPVNLTAGYGRGHHIKLRCTYFSGQGPWNSPPINKSGKLLLCAFDLQNKGNGFFLKNKIEKGAPEKLIMAPELFYFSKPAGNIDLPSQLLKARDSETYLLTRMGTAAYPNLQMTSDFKSFTPVTDLHPERSYNWLTSKLWHWKTFNGRAGDAIIYQPENFDPRKNYPVVFYIYQQLTPGLNLYPEPRLSYGALPIAWLVSNGYIVVCPDIHYMIGSPVQDVYNYAVSAAKALSKLPWVDKKHIGIQGHSFGGYEVNALLTRTGLFAAACEAAGVSDLISKTGFTTTGPDMFAPIEQDIYGMNATPWQHPLAYQKNSPIWHADQISTPLLILHNKNDGRVEWYQAVELFTALRRLNKKVWLLQYDHSGHTLDNHVSDELDFTIRLGQFFDHYLKGAPAPKWMVEGIPASKKQIDNGLTLEPGREP